MARERAREPLACVVGYRAYYMCMNDVTPILSETSDAEKYTIIAKNLLTWFDVVKRPLPWRENYEPYAVWISEIMLQQTQMERGVQYFNRWMERFPTIESVAMAKEEELLKAWEGLGYYRRVKNIQASAKTIMQEHGGVFPSNVDAIRALSGIGEYTSGAIASIAFNVPVSAVDGNVERVFSRLFDLDMPVKEKHTAKRIRELVMLLQPKDNARNFNQALMEFGALVCRKKAECERCPLSNFCEAFRLGIPHERPVPVSKKPVQNMDVATGILVHNGRIYMQRRPETGLWAGFWEFTGGRIEKDESPENAIVREYMEETGFEVQCVEKLAVIRHGYTNYRVTLHCFLLEAVEELGDSTLTAATACKWIEFHELDTLTLPAGHRKLVDMLEPSRIFK